MVVGAAHFFFGLERKWSVVVNLSAIVTFFVWLHEAAVTVRGRPGITMTPFATIAWFFVPFVNLWLPFRAIADIARASHPRLSRETPAWIRVWQGLLFFVVVLQVIANATQSAFIGLAVIFAWLGLCVAVIGTIRALEPNLARLRRKQRAR